MTLWKFFYSICLLAYICGWMLLGMALVSLPVLIVVWILERRNK